ncbi:MAG: hypothetical protein ABEH66_03350 [Halobacteriales archaeon]
MAGVPQAIDRLRRPEYTGDNRCIPCTLVNLLIAASLGIALGAVWLPAAGAVAFALSALAIYLRGYLVPGTPTLTRRYMPVRVLELFGKRPEERRSGAITASGVAGGATTAGESSSDGEPAVSEPAAEAGADPDHTPDGPGDDERPIVVGNPTEILTKADVVRECDDGDDLCLTDWFRDAWVDRLAEFVDDEDSQVTRLAGMLGVEPDALRVKDVGDSMLVERDGEPIGSWISRVSFAADMAAESILEERIEGWSRIDVRQRSDMLSPLRGFLQTCPLCGGEMTFEAESYGEDDPESCCFASEIYTARCADCEERFVEIERSETEDRSPYGVTP